MKQSRIKRLVSKKLARLLQDTSPEERPALETRAERESADTVEKMRAKGYRLATRLDSGEGVFVRDDEVVGLHIQLPAELYGKLDAECRNREATKRSLVIAALEAYLGPREPSSRS